MQNEMKNLICFVGGTTQVKKKRERERRREREGELHKHVVTQ